VTGKPYHPTKYFNFERPGIARIVCYIDQVAMDSTNLRPRAEDVAGKGTPFFYDESDSSPAHATDASTVTNRGAGYHATEDMDNDPGSSLTSRHSTLDGEEGA
jgi:hypothetical protein